MSVLENTLAILQYFLGGHYIAELSSQDCHETLLSSHLHLLHHLAPPPRLPAHQQIVTCLETTWEATQVACDSHIR